MTSATTKMIMVQNWIFTWCSKIGTMTHRYVYRKIDNEEMTWLEGTWPLDLRNAGKSILRFDLDGVTLVIKIPSQQGVFENPSRQMV